MAEEEVQDYLEAMKGLDPKAFIDGHGNVRYRMFSMRGDDSTDVEVTEVCATPEIIKNIDAVRQSIQDSWFYQNPAHC